MEIRGCRRLWPRSGARLPILLVCLSTISWQLGAATAPPPPTGAATPASPSGMTSGVGTVVGAQAGVGGDISGSMVTTGVGTGLNTQTVVVTEPWTIRPIDDLSMRTDQLSQAIFNLIEDISLTSINTRSGGSAYIKIGRHVYDNHDVRGSWTVVDHMITTISMPFWTYHVPFGTGLFLGFNLNGTLQSDFLDIRQVLPPAYSDLAIGDRRLTELAARERLEGTATGGKGADAGTGKALVAAGVPAGTADAPALTTGPGGDVFAGLEAARYSRLWNILVFPGRIPFKAAWIDHLEIGEIISYAGMGMVELGPDVGWTVDLPTLNNSIGATASATTFLTGRYRISVLREDAHHARVKLTRVLAVGRRAALDSGTEDELVGFLLVHTRINNTALIPFSFASSRTQARNFAIVYRYDLDDPHGREAFGEAARGRFSLSDELAGGAQWRSLRKPGAVRKIQTRLTRSDLHDTSLQTRLAFFYRHLRETSLEIADEIITLPRTTVHLMRSIAKSQRFWRWVWGSETDADHTYRTVVDLDRWARKAPDALTLTVEGDISDSDASGVDFNDYIDEVEAATGRLHFFPRPPRFRPVVVPHRIDPNDAFDRRLGASLAWSREQPLHYGRVSFFYRVVYDQHQVAEFLDTPLADRWHDLEQVFGVAPGTWSTRGRRLVWALTHIDDSLLEIPLALTNIDSLAGSKLLFAERIQDDWAAAGEKTGIRERVRRLGVLFNHRLFGYQLCHLLHLRLAGEQVSYLIQGESRVFGNLREQGRSQIEIDPGPDRLDRAIDFDKPVSHLDQDPEGAIIGSQIAVIDQDHLRLGLILPDAITIDAMIIRLVALRPWHLPHEVYQQVCLNRDGLLHPGPNTLNLSATSGPFVGLMSHLEPGARYQFDIAITRDGTLWGAISASPEFTMPPAKVP